MSNRFEARFELDDISSAAEIFGEHDHHLTQIEKALGVRLVARGQEIIISGDKGKVEQAQEVLLQMQKFNRAGNRLTSREVSYAIKAAQSGIKNALVALATDVAMITPRGKQIKPKTIGQKKYVEQIKTHDIVFAIGPAGTGKTYLAVVMAVKALRNKDVERLVLTRPAVEAGEKLGFLPGDLQEKVNPYLRPLYDSLYDILGVDNTLKYLEKNIIEIAPLAYMRGRTLEDSFIILDEAQNTTPEQMKMFLTRLGFGSKAVITGDITQTDLPRGQASGLIHALSVLKGIKGLGIHRMTGEDIVRHPLVEEIIKAYEAEEQKGVAKEE
ncbi:MAG TPA: PhoH family protein [Bacillota bacterium]|nr:PhoH family protein [Peptococcaceae bacterium MAG4]NLW37370.1 PhoH family protein [Peptococcaceae bacterium]HPZ43861.1 PhoH family protein [Bacillota bacterium]HQD76362.1 PhoH family protein [Bacillota bacterium]HUM59048.1 PhoH family protein [Bacillota bacterium]